MPEWLTNILPQFPVLVLVGWVAWYAYQKIEKANENHTRRERELHDRRSRI
jgi:hypothetical protein